MPRLYRPAIPLEVRCRVALRQLGEMWPDKLIEAFRMKPGDPYLKGLGVRVPRLGLGRLLALKLDQLADLLDCSVSDLRLDHDPALENRPQERHGLSKKTFYTPDANDPEHLIYREKNSHHIKTNVRGDHGQYPDNTIAKRERRRLKKQTPPPNAKIAKTWNLHPCMSCGRVHAKGECRAPKRKWPSRPFQNRRKKR